MQDADFTVDTIFHTVHPEEEMFKVMNSHMLTFDGSSQY